MESFNNNLQGGKKLVKSLEKQAVRRRAWSTPPSPPARPTTSRAEPCIPACSQPVSVLQAPTTPAVVAPGAQPDAPALMVGSGATGYRSIKPVDA